LPPRLGKSSTRQSSSSAYEPQAAEERLSRTLGRNHNGVSTSDLSVSEYVLLEEAGFEPLGFVVGSSICHSSSI
jgi:hypothetical protein